MVAAACSTEPVERPSETSPLLKPASMHALLDELRVGSRQDLKGVLVLIEGDVVSESYFNGASEHDLHDVRSAGKSITSLLVGIAIDRGLLGG